ncbi:MAG: hypothetical protein ACD_58C00292G0002 [uncultured bacterium]|nr:MAG: hypothetical protein ACD_58C00292G0002 [uncultured bacterium]
MDGKRLEQISFKNQLPELSEMSEGELLEMLQGIDSICSKARGEIEAELASRGVYPEPEDDELGIEGG